jgi:hypothetical protein
MTPNTRFEQEPAEGSRDIVERELRRQSSKADDAGQRRHDEEAADEAGQPAAGSKNRQGS